MFSVKELENPKNFEIFVNGIYQKGQKVADKTINLNEGLKNTNDLIKRIVKGENIPHDVSRIIEEVKKYESE